MLIVNFQIIFEVERVFDYTLTKVTSEANLMSPLTMRMEPDTLEVILMLRVTIPKRTCAVEMRAITTPINITPTFSSQQPQQVFNFRPIFGF